MASCTTLAILNSHVYTLLAKTEGKAITVLSQLLSTEHPPVLDVNCVACKSCGKAEREWNITLLKVGVECISQGLDCAVLPSNNIIAKPLPKINAPKIIFRLSLLPLLVMLGLQIINQNHCRL